MPLLNAFLSPIPDESCFLIPLFVKNPGSNEVWIQKINSADVIDDFISIDVGGEGYCQLSSGYLKVEVGDKAIWAFQNGAEKLYGSAADLRKQFDTITAVGRTSISSFVRAQIAEFCENRTDYRAALTESFEAIASNAPLAAEIWRDAVLILPIAKKELASSLPPHLVAFVDRVRVVGRNNVVHIEVPEEIFENARRLNPNDIFRQTSDLCGIFDLDRRVTIERGASRRSPRVDHAFPDVPKGIVRGFGAVGRMIAKSLTGLSSEFVLPSGAKRPPFPHTLRGKSQIKFTFDILDTRDDGINGLLGYHASHSQRGDVRIAIAVQTNLSTARRNTLLQNLSNLRKYFDYIFVVENQLLSFRKTAAPQLALSGRATKFVRACVDGILKIAWATNGPKGREDFLKMFPTGGFCLVGRALSRDDKNPISAALSTMLNEYLDRNSARRFVAVAPTSVLENRSGERFIEDAIVASRSEVITIDTGKGRRAATLLAFGVEPTLLTKERFRDFCAELLSDNGWRVSSYASDGELLTATLDKTKQMLSLGLLVAPTSIEIKARTFFPESKRTRKIPDYILTNARPSHRQKVMVGGHKIEVVHYSTIPDLARRIR